MLFNSYSFLLIFLPVTLVGFFFFNRNSQFWGAAWLAAASIFFYGWWDYRYLPLLLGSIIFNYWSALNLRTGPVQIRRRILIAAICANLALLIYYKYAGFFATSLANLLSLHRVIFHIILPVGISFFTFTQIAFLVDTYQGKVKESRFINYLLFVTYFPHLIAGPVLHHKDMMPQFSDPKLFRLSAQSVAIGVTLFFIGLAKKVLIADNISPFASGVFDGGTAPTMLVAWSGVLAYAFQLYFDFSGYSDMAIGLSRFFGVRLPLNFDSPYKSEDIAEFWRRWHMTLSQFLRDYLYIPLGGNRHGNVRRSLNLMITMVLGGLWHGAGWNFVIWGFLHGVFLSIHQLWARLAQFLHFPVHSGMWRLAGTIITFLAVCVAWVFFRASDFQTAWIILQGMFGANGIALPDSIFRHLAPMQRYFEILGVTSYLGGGSVFVESWSWIFVVAIIIFAFPNTQQILNRFDPALDFRRNPEVGGDAMARMFTWYPTRSWAVVTAALALASLLSLNRPAEFLYFQF
ncbi:MBOAT family O-acyltransferase [Massilia sp. PWRC2]|uniref:MBOAT family O-acyltransferase n=1 Tax=Massilia sp. PWRC2 TaxID=2804626 RepID=UPI003CF47724